jgi:hypothetical protein
MTPLQEELKKYSDPEQALLELTTKFGINVYRHPTLPLCGFKYNQIESPKYDPVVRWSRGTVLEYGTWNLVAQGMKRFFNYGESPLEAEVFNWDNFQATGKEDGSLILLYYYNNEWHVNTSGSFGFGEINDSGISWKNLFWDIFNSKSMRVDSLHPSVTYIFELCSRYNKVVRDYPIPTLRLITTFIGTIECGPLDFGKAINATPVTYYDFTSYDSLKACLQIKESVDPTFEGYVVRDNNGIRFKIKSETYVNLHHLHDNGNLYSLKRLVPIVLKSEQAEVMCVFPELKDKFESIKTHLDKLYSELRDLWAATKDIENQKEFALAIAHNPMKSVLFKSRKMLGKNQTEALLHNEWSESAELILKHYEELLDK